MENNISIVELEQLVKQHEEWLHSNRTEGKKAEIEDRSLAGMDLQKLNLTEFSLVRVNLDNANLAYAKLYGADVQHSFCRNTNFCNARMAGINLSESDLSSAIFSDADLRGAKLKRTNLERANFQGAQCVGIDFLKANLRNTNWKNTYLIAANFTGVDLDGAHFEETTIDEETFHILQRIRPDVGKDKFILTGSLRTNPSLIRRTLVFPPEYYQAGMSILLYFGKILNDYFKDSKPKVSIEQEGLKVTMTIAPREGEKLTIEKQLNNYGLVVQGKLSAEDYLADPLQVIELKNQLRIACLQVESQKEILDLKDKQYHELIKRSDERLMSLEEQVSWMQKLVADGVSGYKSQIERLVSLLKDNNKNEISELLLRLEKILNNADRVTGEESKEANGIIHKLHEIVISGAVSGVAEQLITNLINTVKLLL